MTYLEKHSVLNTVYKIILFFCFLCLFSIIFIPNKFSNDLTASITLISLFIFLEIFMVCKYKSQIKLYNPNNFGIGNRKLNKKICLFLIFIILITFFTIYFYFYIEYKNFTFNELMSLNSIGIPFTHSIRSYIVSPILEETLFRGIFFNYFFNKKSNLNNFLSVFTSGILFGLIHSYNFSLTTFYFLLISWILGTVYMYTKDLRYPMFIHFLINFFNNFILKLAIG